MLPLQRQAVSIRCGGDGSRRPADDSPSTGAHDIEGGTTAAEVLSRHALLTLPCVKRLCLSAFVPLLLCAEPFRRSTANTIYYVGSHDVAAQNRRTSHR